MSWHLLEKVFDEVTKQSTFFGKVWITLLFVFRVIAVTRMGDTVYADEQAAFRCNIKQPGCENVCFNAFSPISHVRFWGFQIIIVATPSVMFMVYAAHKVSQLSLNCKLIGRRIEFPRQKSQSSKMKMAKPCSSKTAKASLHDETASSNRPTPKKTKDFNVWSKQKYDLVTKWKTVPNPAPLTEVISCKNISKLSEPWQRSKEFRQDNPPAYRENAKGHFYDKISIASVPVQSLQTKDGIHCRSIPQSRSSSRSQANSISYAPRRETMNQQHLLVPFSQHQLRRHSDGEILRHHVYHSDTSVLNERRCSEDIYPNNSIPSNSIPVISNSPPHYSVVQLAHINNVPEHHYARQRSDSPIHMTVIQLRSKTERALLEKRSPSFRKKSYCSLLKTNSIIGPRRPASPLIQSHKFSKHSIRCSKRVSHSYKFSERESEHPRNRKRPSTHNASLVQRSAKSSSTADKKCTSLTPVYNSSGYIRFANRIECIQNRIAIAYFLQSLARLLLESVFLWLQYSIFPFDVPELYKCNRSPCPNTVDCYVSRPNEKSILLCFMFGVTVTCIALTALELIFLVKRHIYIIHKEKKMKKGKSCSEENDESKRTPNIGKSDFLKNPHLLEGYANMIKRHSMEIFQDSDSSSDSTTTKSSKSETDTEDLQDNSFNDGDLSSMSDNDMEDLADLNNEQNDAEEAGYV